MSRCQADDVTANMSSFEDADIQAIEHLGCGHKTHASGTVNTDTPSPDKKMERPQDYKEVGSALTLIVTLLIKT